MDLTNYQSRVVYDVLGHNEFNCSLCFLSTAVGRLAKLCSDGLKEDDSSWHKDPDVAKFAEYIGDMWYAVTSIVSLLGIPIASLEKYSKIVDHKGRNYNYWVCKLVGVVGDLNEVMAQFIEKNERAPTVTEVRKLREWEYGDNIRARLSDHCILVMHVLYRLQASLGVTTDDVLGNDFRRRYYDECD